jgi:hypothetical protein
MDLFYAELQKPAPGSRFFARAGQVRVEIMPVTPQPGLKIAPACEPVSAAATLGRPFSCPGRGPQDHEQLLKKSPAAGSEVFKRLWLPNFPRESC